MKLDDLTLGQIKEIQKFAGANESSGSSSIVIGENYFIRTVTHYYTGKVKSVTSAEIVLSDAAWIACTGRFYDCLKSGDLNEVEPFVDDVIVGRAALIDATLWRHDLPKDQK